MAEHVTTRKFNDCILSWNHQSLHFPSLSSERFVTLFLHLSLVTACPPATPSEFSPFVYIFQFQRLDHGAPFAVRNVR